MIYVPSTSPVMTGVGVGTGAAKYTDLVTQSINTMASGNASIDDQLNAYQDLRGLVFSPGTPGRSGGLLEQTNKNDWQRAVDALENSDISQRIQQVSAQYNSTILGIAHASSGDQNWGQVKLDTL